MKFTRETPWGFEHRVSQVCNLDAHELIHYVELNLTGRCDARCITCPAPRYYSQEALHKDESELTRDYDRIIHLLRILRKHGARFLCLYGREPTLWDRESEQYGLEANHFLMRLIEAANDDLGMRICLATSGLHLRENVLHTLFRRNGILFMKRWGSAGSVARLMSHTEAHGRMEAAWQLAFYVRSRYVKTTIIAEFLYTKANRHDLINYWDWCLLNHVIPMVETPLMLEDAASNVESISVPIEMYVADMYNLSVHHYAKARGCTEAEVRESDDWYPPYGSKFPIVCDKMTCGKGIFVERNGDVRLCNGMPEVIGNLYRDDPEDLFKSPRVAAMRALPNGLWGKCARCFYSDRKLCYGCRGNAATRYSERGLFASDPLCFGIAASGLSADTLASVTSPVHAEKIISLFLSEFQCCNR